MRRWFALLPSVAACAGCAVSGAPVHDRLYVGVVRIAGQDPRGDDAWASHVTSLGVKIGQGLRIGYEEEKTIQFSPACRLVVLLPSDAAAETRGLIEGLRREGKLCQGDF